MDLSDLGFTKEELQQKVIDGIVDRFMEARTGDDEGRTWVGDSEFKRKLDKEIQKQIDAAVTKLGESHVAPLLAGMVEGITLQRTTEWGEKKGEPVSFVEYLVQRADAYLREEVNYDGKSKEDAARRGDSYGWKASGTRVATMVHQYLHSAIETAMKQALANANHAIVGGLEQAVKVKLGEVASALKVEVKTK